MLKSTSIIAALMLYGVIGYAQLKENDPRYEKHYRDVAPIETDEIKIEVIRPHSQEGFSQFTAKITNKTDDYILVKKHAVTFSSEENGYGDKIPKEDIDFIEPHGDITRSIRAEGGIGFKVDQLAITLDSAFSRSPVVGTHTGAGEFKMKPDKESIMMEPFAVTLKKWRFDPKELSADFKIRYRGEGIGIVNESAIRIRKEDGTMFPNTNSKDKVMIIPPMGTKTVTVVRPFAKDEVGKAESVYVVLDNALQESQSRSFKVPGFQLTFDPEKTKLENK